MSQHRHMTGRALSLLAAAIAVAAATAPSAVGAQAAGGQAGTSRAVIDSQSAAYLRDQFLADLDTVHVKFLALAQAIPEDKYAWRPADSVRSISEVLMHVAGEWYYWAPMSVAAQAPADFGRPREALPRLERQYTRKADVIDQLNKAWAHCRSQIAGVDATRLTGSYQPWGVTLPQAAFAMSGDLHEHLGQLIAYARSVGVKPPWSK